MNNARSKAKEIIGIVEDYIFDNAEGLNNDVGHKSTKPLLNAGV